MLKNNLNINDFIKCLSKYCTPSFLCCVLNRDSFVSLWCPVPIIQPYFFISVDPLRRYYLNSAYFSVGVFPTPWVLVILIMLIVVEIKIRSIGKMCAKVQRSRTCFFGRNINDFITNLKTTCFVLSFFCFCTKIYGDYVFFLEVARSE